MKSVDTSLRQVLIVRGDLGVRNAGKLIAQGAHACLGALLNTARIAVDAEGSSVLTLTMSQDTAAWMAGLATKIVLTARDEEHLLSLHAQATEAGLPCALIQDAGLTEFDRPTYTAVGIGPARREKLDPITRELILFR